ncbi:MAG: poly(A) polymerase [Flavobacteriales bacterium]|jgi:poly(A) polymerase
MLKSIKKLFSGPAPKRKTGLQVIEHSEHGIRDRLISKNALRVIEDLQRAHFQAYLVGGGVRDLLLGEEPKDFDVATDATPEQVNSVFRRARIIGRRFKIVHVRMGREIIEVTTFRGSHETKGKAAVQSDKGVLLRDNVYGNLESDAFRRDFTVNALYYDPSERQILDYTNGLHDLRTGVLRIIGDPDARYKEDPVRMLRAIRFACRLNFTLEHESQAPIRKHAEYIQEIAAARLFEEILKLCLSGYAESILQMLHDYNLLSYLFPSTAKALVDKDGSDRALLQLATRNTDTRIQQEKRVTPAYIYAAFLWPALRQLMAQIQANGKVSEQEAMYQASHEIVQEQMQATTIPKRFLIPMREIWSLQHRLTRRDSKRALGLLEHKRFRAAYDFLLLREDAGELQPGLGDWWTKFQFAEEEEQLSLINSVKNTSAPKKRRRKPRKKHVPTET